ncbi:MAG: hypothetical protein H6Q69_3216 [Firmicutes bacterium]|nr:hypothetical protein [Bacillota bacterium]
MQKRLWRLMKIQWKRLLMLRGDRRKIARGIALGIAMNFIPTLGIGPPFVYLVARIIKAHRIAAIVSTVGVKVAIPLLYILNYIIGELLLEQKLVLDLSLSRIMDVGVIFFLGMVINFMVTFVIAYYLALWWIGHRRDKSLGRQK